MESISVLPTGGQSEYSIRCSRIGCGCSQIVWAYSACLGAWGGEKQASRLISCLQNDESSWNDAHGRKEFQAGKWVGMFIGKDRGQAVKSGDCDIGCYSLLYFNEQEYPHRQDLPRMGNTVEKEDSKAPSREKSVRCNCICTRRLRGDPKVTNRKGGSVTNSVLNSATRQLNAVGMMIRGPVHLGRKEDSYKFHARGSSLRGNKGDNKNNKRES